MMFSALRQGSDSLSFSSRRCWNSFLASVFPKRFQFSFFLFGFWSRKGGTLSYEAWPQSYNGLSSTLYISWHEWWEITQHNDKINHVPVFRARVHPQCLIFFLLLEDGSGYGKIMLQSKESIVLCHLHSPYQCHACLVLHSIFCCSVWP